MTNLLTPEELRRIYEECGGDTSLLAQRLNLSREELATRVTPAPTPPARRSSPPADLGKDYFRKYIVSVRHCENPLWPWADQDKIEDARNKYEAGTHEMCQGRDRDWFVLYCIPRKKRCGARKFFQVFE